MYIFPLYATMENTVSSKNSRFKGDGQVDNLELYINEFDDKFLNLHNLTLSLI